VKGISTINARGETVAKSPSYREPFKKRRCLVPASGFYEWKKLDPKNKQPFGFDLHEGDFNRWLERGEAHQPPIDLLDHFPLMRWWPSRSAKNVGNCLADCSCNQVGLIDRNHRRAVPSYDLFTRS
jgi:hypothetical protein